MKTEVRNKIGRVAISLAAAGAIVGSVLVGIAGSTGETHAALKWNEHVTVAKDWCGKNNLKKYDPTTCPTQAP